MAETWTVRRIVSWIHADLDKRGVSSPRLDADLLVAHALSVPRMNLYLDLERPLIASELARIRALLERRRQYEPMAYILGQREFYGLTLAVSPAVLVPRPDTEILVEQALRRRAEGLPGGRLADVCTGSGAIGLALAAKASDRQVLLTDLSEAALEVARANAAALGLSQRVELRHGDLFAALPAGEPFALIAINPPYIGAHELPDLMPDVRDHEPRLALDAGEDPLSFYRRIAEGAAQHVLPGGALLLEVGAGQAPEVVKLFESADFVSPRVHRDYGGVERVVELERAR